MIKDLKGRKWFLRFRQYTQGWYWEAKCEGKDMRQTADMRFFKTKALAEADARRRIPGSEGRIISEQKLQYEDLGLTLASLHHDIKNELAKATCDELHAHAARTNNDRRQEDIPGAVEESEPCSGAATDGTGASTVLETNGAYIRITYY